MSETTCFYGIAIDDILEAVLDNDFCRERMVESLELPNANIEDTFELFAGMLLP